LTNIRWMLFVYHKNNKTMEQELLRGHTYIIQLRNLSISKDKVDKITVREVTEKTYLLFNEDDKFEYRTLRTEFQNKWTVIESLGNVMEKQLMDAIKNMKYELVSNKGAHLAFPEPMQLPFCRNVQCFCDGSCHRGMKYTKTQIDYFNDITQNP